MKFSEKLQKLRKKNNLSQEQLADMLDVTRQSVSKWESGQTYPEMDKLIVMCKIFKCSLDDLTNDSVSDIVIEEKKKSNFTNFVDNILELISKTYNMLKTMTTKELIKCIFSMFILGIILLIAKVPFDFILEKLSVIFSVIPNVTIEMLLTGTFDLIFTICFFILYILIFTYIFKTAYLDKYQNKELFQEEKEEEQETDQKEEPIKKETKTYKPKNKKNADPFFSFLGRIIVFCVKAFVIFMTIPFIISLVLLALSFAVVFLLIFKKIIYIGVLLGIIFTIILNVLVIELVVDFIFNKQVKVKRLFITFIVGLIGLGLSAGIFCIELSSIKYINEAPNDQSSKTITELVDYENNMFIDERYSGYQISYKPDNTLQNKIKIEITYYDQYSTPYVSKSKSDNYISVDIHNEMSSVNDLQIDLIEEALKTKTFYNYSKLYEKKVTISASNNILTKLNQTREKYNNETIEYYNEYEESIENLENENYELQTKLEEQENKTYQLEEENEQLKDKINEYKETLKSITND